MYYEGKHILFEQFPPRPSHPRPTLPVMPSHVPRHNDSIRVNDMTETGATYLSLIVLHLLNPNWHWEWGLGVSVGPRPCNPPLTGPQSSSLRGVSLGPIGWCALSLAEQCHPEPLIGQCPGLTWSTLESLLGHRVPVFSHNNNFLNTQHSSAPRVVSLSAPHPLLCWLHHRRRWVSPNRFTTKSNL